MLRKHAELWSLTASHPSLNALFRLLHCSYTTALYRLTSTGAWLISGIFWVAVIAMCLYVVITGQPAAFVFGLIGAFFSYWLFRYRRVSYSPDGVEVGGKMWPWKTVQRVKMG